MSAPATTPGPGLYDIHSGRIHRGDDGPEVTTTIRARPERPPGRRLIGWAAFLLAALAGGVFAISYAGQFTFIYAARHQVLASNAEAGMFDVGMVILALLALGLALAGKPSRIERAGVMICAFGSAAMNYAAADVLSPRSILAYVAPPLFLAFIVDRVIAVIRRHKLGSDEGSPWAPFGRFLLAALGLAGMVALYTLRWLLDCRETSRGLRQMVLNAAPLPGPTPAVAIAGQSPPSGTKKDALLALYRQHPGYGDRSQASALAAELGPRVGLQPGTARTYLYAELNRSEAAQ